MRYGYARSAARWPRAADAVALARHQRRCQRVDLSITCSTSSAKRKSVCARGWGIQSGERTSAGSSAVRMIRGLETLGEQRPLRLLLKQSASRRASTALRSESERRVHEPDSPAEAGRRGGGGATSASKGTRQIRRIGERRALLQPRPMLTPVVNSL